MHSHLLQEVTTAEKVLAYEKISSEKYEYQKPSNRKLMNFVKLPKFTYYDYKRELKTTNQQNKIEIQKQMVEIFEDNNGV